MVTTGLEKIEIISPFPNKKHINKWWEIWKKNKEEEMVVGMMKRRLPSLCLADSKNSFSLNPQKIYATFSLTFI